MLVLYEFRISNIYLIQVYVLNRKVFVGERIASEFFSNGFKDVDSALRHFSVKVNQFLDNSI